MSFVNYLREQEEAEEVQAQEELKAKIVALFTTGEPVSDDQVHAMAEEEGMEHDDLEAIIYQMLSDLLMAQAEEEGEAEADEEMEDAEEVEEGCKKKMSEESEEGEEDDDVEAEDEM